MTDDSTVRITRVDIMRPRSARPRRRLLLASIAGLAACASLAAASTATAASPGPPLLEPADALTQSLTCGPGVDHAASAPVLLVHGTLVSKRFWEQGYARVLPTIGRPVCVLDLPGRETYDVQRSVEYVVNAIRTVNDRAGRPVVVIGHSQGGTLSAMALRFWPDLAARVQDLVLLAGVGDEGTSSFALLCTPPCGPAGHQLRPGTRLLAALARKPLPAGPGYTAISTKTDELVFPQPQAGLIPGMRNVAVQDLCPGRIVEHGLLAVDSVAFALARDAMDRPGPADPSAIDRRAACGRLFMPGMGLLAPVQMAADFASGLPAYYAHPVDREPALRSYLDPAAAG